VSVPFAAWSSADGQIEPCNRLRSDNVPQQACGVPPDWWCDAIDELHALGITDRACGDFTVNDVFNRAEWATLISRTLQLEQSPAFARCQNPFVDLEPGAWYVPHLSALAGLEYGDGVSVFSVPANRQAQPGNTTNRCEAVKSLVEAWNPPDRPAPRLLFSDRQAIPAWCLPYVEQAAAHELITNRADPFAPADALSAGAGATMLTNAIDSLGRPLPAEDDFSAEVCAQACEAACRVGEVRCAGGNRERCQDAGACPGWAVDPCEAGQICDAGACIRPDQPAEACNGQDDDGDGRTDEGVANACGRCGRVPEESCNQVDDDCDGGIDEAACAPGEACNGVDDDDDEQVDEGVRNRCGGCGAEPAEQCDRQDNDCDSRVDEEGCAEPPAEACNGFDDDQDGEVDEGVCVQPGVEICNRVDDDTDGRIDEGCSPPETCNGFDDDGDGQIDEGVCRPDGGPGADCGEGECPAEVEEDTTSGGDGCNAAGRTARYTPIWPLALLILVVRRQRRFSVRHTEAMHR
jgi:hypothetical protein